MKTFFSMTSVAKVASQDPFKTRPVLPALFWFWGGIIACAILISGCARQSEPVVYRLAGSTMGTTYHISLVPVDNVALAEADLQALQQSIDGLLERVNLQMSTYIPESELMRFNRAQVGEWFPVAQELMRVLEISAEINRSSLGAFDITVGPLVELWGFGARDTQDRLPAAAQIARALATIGMDKLELDKAGLRARKRGEIRLDLSAVAKGYGADLVSELLLAQGFENTLVEIGGELRLRGNSQRGTPWKIGVEVPQLTQGATQKAISVTNAGVATSGDYRNYFEVDDKRYSHTLDPRTGYPIDHSLASVTVVAESAAEADAWATALSVLGPEQASTIVEEKKLAVFFIIRAGSGFEESYSTAFAPYIVD